jgi:two-component system, NtrC family, response regulator HydG
MNSERAPLTSLTKAIADSTLPLFPKPKSKVFSSVVRQVARFAADDSVTIVFEGESGTGKNWIARIAHTQSMRASHTLHEKSLATISDSLAGSDLFGHEIGAFTDARTRRSGAFQTANHSTLFIDELGKASSEVQRMLLRVIDERVVCPVGGDRPMKLDVRLMLATNVSIKSLVADGLFLPDLFARLGQFRIQLPALRERQEDIPDLARYFVAKHAISRGYTAGLPTIHPALMSALVTAEWKYNLREFDETLKRLVFEADSETQLTFEHCVGDLEYLRVRTRGRPTKSSPGNVASAVKRSVSIASAARSLGISRSTVYRKLARMSEVTPSTLVAE